MSFKSPSEISTYLPTYDGCYVCGQSHPIGLCIRFYAGEGGKVHALFKPHQNQTSYANIVHGGVISALLDELTGCPICLANDRICYTGELNIRFRSSLARPTSARATRGPSPRGSATGNAAAS